MDYQCTFILIEIKIVLEIELLKNLLFLYCKIPLSEKNNRFTSGSVAQLYSASDFGSEGWGLESLRGHKEAAFKLAAFFIHFYII